MITLESFLDVTFRPGEYGEIFCKGLGDLIKVDSEENPTGFKWVRSHIRLAFHDHANPHTGGVGNMVRIELNCEQARTLAVAIMALFAEEKPNDS